MSGLIVTQRLYWKELRQLLPLAAMLVAGGGLFHLLFMLSDEPRGMTAVRNGSHDLLFLGLPYLFAVGCGGLLVGQERETRTIDWLRGLPISASRIVRSKLLVGLVALGLIWLVSVALAVLRHWSDGTLSRASDWLVDGLRFGSPILQSVYLLGISFAACWYLKSALMAMIAVVPLAIVPQWIGDTAQSLWMSQTVSTLTLEQSQVVMTATYAVFALVAGGLAWSQGLQKLSAEATTTMRNTIREHQVAVHSASRLDRPPSQFGGLVWQFARQNAAVFAMGLVAAGLLMAEILSWSLVSNVGYADFDQFRGELLARGGFCCGLVGAVLGIWTTQSDAVHGRVGFLADRGVSSAKLWLSRVPVALFVLLLLAAISWLLTLLRVKNVFGDNHVVYPDRYGDLAIEAATGSSLISLGTFAIGQWIGTFFRSPVLAVVVGPVFIGFVAAYTSWVLESLGMPLWLIGSLAVSASIVALVSTRQWMDRRRGVGYWLRHVATAALLLAVSLVPYNWFRLTLPDISAEVQAAMLTETGRRPFVIIFHGFFRRELESLQEAIASKRVWRAARAVEALRSEFEQQPSRCISDARGLLAFRMLFAWWEAERAGKLGDAETFREVYRDGVSLATEFARRLRPESGYAFPVHEGLEIHESNDALEYFIFRTVSRPEAREELGDKVYTAAVELVGDFAGRQAARRSVIAAAFRDEVRDYNSETYDGSIVGWRSDLDRVQPTHRVPPLKHSLTKRYLAELWALASTEGIGDNSRRRKLETLWFEMHPTRDAFDLDLDAKELARREPLAGRKREFERTQFILPGALWNSQWEHEAAALRRSLGDG